MTSLHFKLADPDLHRDDILNINIEYMSWVASGIETSFGISVASLLGMSVPAYVESVIDKVCGDKPPRGVFYLAEYHGEIAGMIGLRWLRDGAAEIKRLYVRPTCRGQQLGAALLRKILQDASAFGYQRVFLDTAPFMLAAQRLYHTMGFTACAPYTETEVPTALHATWHFMGLDLNDANLSDANHAPLSMIL